MKLLRDLKERIRLTRLYEPFLRAKARREDRRYVALRDGFRVKSTGVSNQPPAMLRASWSGPREKKSRLKDVRMFVVDVPTIGGPWFQSELTRSFDTTVFSISRFIRGFHSHRSDLLPYSTRVCPDDRVLPYPGAPVDRTMRTALQEAILSVAREAHAQRPLDLCLIYATVEQVDVGTLRRLRGLGAPVVVMSLDDKHSFESIRPLIGSYDLHLTNSVDCTQWYFTLGVPALYFPQGVDPELFKPLGFPRDIPVSFVGQAYGMRLEFIRQLRRLGIETACFGSGWPNGLHHNQIEVYCRSIVNLGIGFTGFSANLTCIKGRDFEVPATGSLYLTTFDFELAKLFHVGQEVVCYRSAFDCAELITHYLNHPEEVVALGTRARNRCMEDHTWTRRIESVLRSLGILASSPAELTINE